MNQTSLTLLRCLLVGTSICLSLHAEKAAPAPALPKFLIIGSESVDREVAEVAKRLQGRATVVHAQPAVDTIGKVLGNLDQWLAQEKPQVIMVVPGRQEKPAEWSKAVDRLQKQSDTVAVLASDSALAGWRSTGLPVLDLGQAGKAVPEAMADCLLRQWIVLQYSKPDQPHPGGPEVAAKYRADEAKHDAEVPEIFKQLPIGKFQMPANAEAWQRERPEVLRVVKDSLGDLPSRPEPVKARVVSREYRRNYTLERVSIDNGVGNDVSALVLVPDKRTNPAPAILWLHSSTPDKNALITPGLDPESLGEAFVRNGYVVVAPDAWYYGDRAANVPSGPVDVYHRGVPPHADLAQNTLIKLNMWLGRTVWGMMVRDDQVALDYLCQRPEVDSKRIGATGMSMGSTRAWWLAHRSDGRGCLSHPVRKPDPPWEPPRPRPLLLHLRPAETLRHGRGACSHRSASLPRAHGRYRLWLTRGRRTRARRKSKRRLSCGRCAGPFRKHCLSGYRSHLHAGDAS